MLTHKDHFHGSDLEEIERIYHIPKEDILSFSANVNPLGVSEKLKQALAEHLDAVASYPDREYTNLRQCIASYTGTEPEHIIVGNGSTELISLFLQIYHPQKAMIIGPTYSEYEREITLGGGSCHYFPLREENDFRLNTETLCGQLDNDLDLLVLCNPNNPTSTAITRKQMRRILDACLEHGIYVMVDETYVEFAPNEAAITSVPLTNYYSNLIILRGTSKFFAVPGLRLGYAITGNRDTAASINTRKDPWTINSLAEAAGEAMFRDQDYIASTKKLIQEERDRMYQTLHTWDSVKVYEPQANFILMQITKPDLDGDILFEHCIQKKMLIRCCSTFPFLDARYVRFCMMKPSDNDRLLSAFDEVLNAPSN